MTILEAALSESVYQAAQQYLASGVSVIPLRGKISTMKSWRIAQQYKASFEVLSQWHRAGMMSGVGVVCGAVSGNLVVLDFDSHEAVAEFKDEFPNLTNTLTIASGSRRGEHLYFHVSVLPNSLLVKNYELRANGMYVVAPPSPHASGNEYMVARAVEPMTLDNMHAVVRWIKSKKPQQPPAPTVPVRHPTPAAHTGRSQSREEYFRKRYVDTAVAAQLDMVAAYSEGSKYRNIQLHNSAVILGQFVGAGVLSRAWIENELLSVALRIGLTQGESVATIRSGINYGQTRPRRIPGPPAPRR